MIVLSVGANLMGTWGSPETTLRRALGELKKSQVNIISTSKLYHTIPYGIDTQRIFLNAVLLATSALPPDALMAVCRRIEAQAGRKPARRWQSRPLDIDIVDYNRLICNWNMSKTGSSPRLILPHPRAHERAFVLVPLAEVAPFWHHPVFGRTAIQLLKAPGVLRTGAVINGGTFWI